MSDSLQPHGLYSPWNSPGQNTGMGSLSLLQGIFPIQGSNPGLLHYRRILYPPNHKGSSRILEWVAYPFSSGSSWLRNWTGVSCTAARFFTNWAMREPLCCVRVKWVNPSACHGPCMYQQWQLPSYCHLWIWTRETEQGNWGKEYLIAEVLTLFPVCSLMISWPWAWHTHFVGSPCLIFNFLYFLFSPLRNTSESESDIIGTTFKSLSAINKDWMIANLNSLLPTNYWWQAGICQDPEEVICLMHLQV